MPSSIEVARREVQRVVEHAVELADSDDTRFWNFERELWSRLLAVGRALVSLFLLRQADRMRERAAEYLHDGKRFVISGERTSMLGTRFGKVSFVRPIGRHLAPGGGPVDLPVDRQLRLCSGFSVGLVMAMTRLSAQLAFAPARTTFRFFHEWAPSSRAVLRMVDAVGEQARPFLEQLPPPTGDGDVLVIEVDGRGAPMLGPAEYARRRAPHSSARGSTKRHRLRKQRRAVERPRRRSGEKSKNAKVAFVGVLYTLRKTPNGREGPINKRLVATFESHEALFKWLQREAIKRGYGVKPCLFLADGSEHIWRLQQQYLPLAEVCIDWFHIVEKVWAAGECLYPAGSRGLQLWFGRMKKLLRNGRSTAVVRELSAALLRIPKTGPGNKGRRKRLTDVVAHFREHRHRMHYDRLRARDLVIGTGAAEGAVRNLVAIRLDGPGMRWGRDRAERVLHLRCVLVSHLWDDFSSHVAAGPALKLRPSPMPAVPHEARRKQAA